MAGFTSEALEKKLLDLNNSQQSIQTLSLWLLHHRKHNATIVQTWFKELKKARQSRKLTFMYLANDVIQNSRKKGPEFTKEFSNVLRAAFENVAKDADEKTWSGLDRILTIWKDRGIYDAEQIKQFKAAIGNKKQTKDTNNHSKNSKDDNHSTKSKDNKSTKHNEMNRVKREKREKASKSNSEAKKRKLVDVNSDISSNNNNNNNAVKETMSNSTTVANITINSNNNNNSKALTTLGTDTSLITQITVNGDSQVDTDSLIKRLQLLENAASCDALVREKIANLPPEVSDLTLLESIRDKGAAEKLSQQVDEACVLLNEYNIRLTKELDERKLVSAMLSTFVKNQKDILTQVEDKLANFKEKLRKMLQIKNELQSHLQNLPDLSLLPSVTGGLAPLPSAGDLFNIAARNSQLHENDKHLNISNIRNDDEKRSIESSCNTSPNTASPADYETVSALTPSSNEESLQHQT